MKLLAGWMDSLSVCWAFVSGFPAGTGVRKTGFCGIRLQTVRFVRQVLKVPERFLKGKMTVRTIRQADGLSGR